MRFLDLTVTAFGPFADPFALPLANQGLVLVEGVNLDAGDSADSNAAGKSMLFEAVLWCLFGKMARYGNRQVGATEACNPQRGLAEVAVTVETADGIFRIERSRRLTGSPKVKITANGAPLPAAALHAYEHDLSPLLGFEYETARVALFLQGTGLTLATAGYTSQMHTLEAVLRFDVMTRAQDLARKQQRDLGVEETIARADVVRWAESALAAERAIANLEALSETAQEAEITESIRAGEARAAENHAIAAGLAQAHAELDATVTVRQRLSARLELTQARIVQLEAGEGDPECALCKSPLTPEHRLRLLDDSRTELDALQADYTGVTAEWQHLLRQTHEHDEALARNRTILDMVAVHQRALTDLRERADKRLSLIRTEQDRLDEAAANEAAATAKLQALTASLKKAAFWAHAFGPTGLKAHLLQMALPVLNQAAAEYSQLLADGTVRVQFTRERESKADDLLTLTAPGVGEYLACSMGERRRVAIVLALAFRALARWRMAEPVNLGLWDEVFDGLDEAGIRRLVQVLQRDMDEQESVYVITHSPHVKAMFPGARILRVTKQDGAATVQWA